MVTTLLNTLKQHITNDILYIMLALHYYLRVLKYCRFNKKREKSTLSASFHAIFS